MNTYGHLDDPDCIWTPSIFIVYVGHYDDREAVGVYFKREDADAVADSIGSDDIEEWPLEKTPRLWVYWEVNMHEGIISEPRKVVVTNHQFQESLKFSLATQFHFNWKAGDAPCTDGVRETGSYTAWAFTPEEAMQIMRERVVEYETPKN